MKNIKVVSFSLDFKIIEMLDSIAKEIGLSKGKIIKKLLKNVELIKVNHILKGTYLLETLTGMGTEDIFSTAN